MPESYFRALESEVLPLLERATPLSPAEYKVARDWEDAGMPLPLVVETIEEVIERRRARGEGPPRGLRYFAGPVSDAWKAHRRLQAGGERAEPETFDLGARLRRLAAALPEELAGRPGWGARIEALSGPDGAALEEVPDMEEVEAALGHLDDELLATAAEALPDEVSDGLEREVERALARLRGRLPKEEAERSRTHLYRRLLRERTGIPVLSLFSPEAEGTPP